MKPLTLTTSKDGRAYARINYLADWVIPGDVHLPLHDTKAVNLALSSKGNGLFIQGDLLDFYWISRWPKDSVQTKAAGYEATRNAVMQFVAATGRFEYVIYGGGNHEDRVGNLSRSYPGFDSSWWWMLRDVLPTTWTYLPHGYRAELLQKTTSGLPIIVEHGDRATHIKAPTTDHLVAAFPGQCTIIGHTHRVQQSMRTTWKKGKSIVTSAYSCGHLSDCQKNNYAAAPNWQQGFATVSKEGSVQNHLIVNGALV
jgi:hypothetical protein